MVDEDLMKVSSSMMISWINDEPIDELIDKIYPNIADHVADSRYEGIKDLITLLNEYVNKLNERVIQKFYGQEKVYNSFDTVKTTHKIFTH